MVNDVTYRDPTPNNFPKDYDPENVDPRVKLRSDSIKHKQFGKHTREAMYQGLEIGAATAGEAKDIAINTNERQAQSEKEIQNEIKIVDDVLAEITKHSGDSAMPEVVEARNDGEQTFPSLKARLNQTLAVDDSLDGSEVRHVFKAEIERVKERIKANTANTMNVLFITDLHWEQDNPNAYLYSNRSINHLSNALAFDTNVNAIIMGGDNTHSYSKSLIYIKKQIEQINDKFYDTGLSDKFSLLGNHDDGSLRSILLNRRLNPDDIILKKEFIKSMHATVSNFGETRMPDNLAFYKDYPDKKVRLIGLNALDIPDMLTNEDGTIKYNRQHKFAYSEAQLKWLAETVLLRTPEDYHTIIFSHIQSSPSPQPVQKEADTTDTRYNFDLLQQLLWAFQAGTSVVLNNELDDFKVDLTVDFTKQGKRTLIGFVNGHTHWESIVDVGTFKDVHCLNSVYEGIDDELINQGPGKPDRRLNSVTEDAFTIISIDSTNKHVDLIGFGAATDRGFDYD